MPIYNIETYLSRAIDSILTQTVKDIEVILVNDGSNDSSGEICDNYSKIDHRVKVLHKENGGVSSARNRGLEIVTGDFIIFVDGDDWIEKEMFEELLKPMLADQYVEVCIGTHVFELETGILIDAFKDNEEGFLFQPQIYQQMLDRTYWGWELCGKLYKKELFDNCRCNERIAIAEDLLANWQIFRRVKKVYYRPRKRYHYCIRSTSATHEEFSEKVFTGVEVLNEIDDQTDLNDILVKKMNRERLLCSCIRLILKMFLVDSEKYYKKIIMYKKLLKDKFEYNFNDFDLSDIQKEQGEILISESFSVCKQLFEKEYQIIVDSLRKFSGHYKKIYIYGAGIIATDVAYIMKSENLIFEAFVVSDIKVCATLPDHEHVVLPFADIDLGKIQNVGMILAMNKKNTNIVLKKFQQRGFKEYFNIADCKGILLCNTGR